jgi:alpha-1,2-mannosyltransferase
MTTRTIALNIVVLAYFLVSLGPHGIGFSPYRIDLDVYRIGSQVWLHGGNLYGTIPPTSGGAHLPFSYPPIAAVLLAPLALIPMPAATLLLTLATVALTALVIRVFLLSASRGRPRWATTWRAVAWLLPAALLLEPVRNTLLYGQINVALMTLVSADCLVRSPRWPRGVLTGIAAAVKLTPAVFVLFFVLRKDWRAARVSGLSFLALSGAGFLLAPRDSIEYWTSIIFQPGRPGPPVYAANQSITGVIARAGLDPHSPAGTALWVGVSAVVVAIACLGMRRALAAARPAWALSLNAFAGLLISPISWSHHWVWGEMAVLTLAVQCWHRPRGLALAAAGALIFALAPQWWFPNGGNRELHWALWQQVAGSSYVIYAFVVLLAAAVSLRERGQIVRDEPLAGTGRLDESANLTVHCTVTGQRNEDGCHDCRGGSAARTRCRGRGDQPRGGSGGGGGGGAGGSRTRRNAGVVRHGVCVFRRRRGTIAGGVILDAARVAVAGHRARPDHRRRVLRAGPGRAAVQQRGDRRRVRHRGHLPQGTPVGRREEHLHAWRQRPAGGGPAVRPGRADDLL